MGWSGRVPERVVRLFELDCCALPTAAGYGGIFAVPARRSVSHLGPAGTVHYTDSCVVVFEIAADLEGQLEIITDVPAGATCFSPDGRLPHIPSLVWAAAGDER